MRMINAAMLVSLLVASTAGAGPQLSTTQRVMTVAGGGLGARGPATSAMLGQLGNLVADRSGNIYISDLGNHLIWRLNPAAGKLVAVAGTGAAGKGADSGPARSIPLSTLFLALDPEGNLNFTDSFRVRQLVPATRFIQTIAGNGEGVWNGGTITEEVPANTISLGFLTGIAVSRFGEIFLGDPRRCQLLRIGVTGRLSSYCRLPSELLSRGSPEMEPVFDVAVAPSGEVYFSDQRHNYIFRVSAGVAVPVAGTGVRREMFPAETAGAAQEQAGDGDDALSTPLDCPTQIAFDRHGNLFFGEAHGSIRRVDGNGQIHSLCGPKVSSGPISGLTVTRNGDVVFACNPQLNAGQIFRLSSSDSTTTLIAGSGLLHCCGDGGPASQSALWGPYGVAVAPDGDLIIADRFNGRIRRVNARTSRIATIAGGGAYSLPGGYCTAGYPVRSAPPAGRIRATEFKVLEPLYVTVDRVGNVLFAQPGGSIYRIDARDGVLTTVGKPREGTKSGYPCAVFESIGGIAAGPDGETIVVAERRVWRIGADGGLLIVAGTGKDRYSGDGGPALSAELSRPGWPAVDHDGNIFFVDEGSYRIRMIGVDGKISTVAGNGKDWGLKEGPALRGAIGFATGLAVDPSGKTLYFAAGNRLWRLNRRTSTLRTIAGTDEPGDRPSPDGPLASVRILGEPRALACGRNGTVYFTESKHDRVRAVVRAR